MGAPGSIEDIRPFAELARTATTAVYKAYQKSLDRFVLLKRLQPAFSGDDDLASRFQDEARIAARIQHPNVVSIYNFGSDAEGAYFVGEFVEGFDLGDIIARGRLPVDLALYVLDQSARGLKAAHDRNVLHRDLKPSNILISHEGEVKLCDFGLASISDSPDGLPREIRGTLAYLAPEQILANDVDERSDLFSLGATFFEMVTGRRAFPGSSTKDIFDAILHRDPLVFLSATAGVDEDVRGLCARLLARDPAERFESTGDVIAAIDSCFNRRGRRLDAPALRAYLDDPASYPVDVPIRGDGRLDVKVVPPDLPLPSLPSLPFRRRTLAAAAAVAVLLLLAVFFVLREAAETPSMAQASPADGRRLAALHGAVDTTAIVRLLQHNDRSESSAAAAAPPSTQVGFASLTAVPSAAIFVGGQSLGTATSITPLVLRLTAGVHTVTFRHPEYAAATRSIRVRPGETTHVAVTLQQANGRLELQVSPWADVYIDGESVGQAPLTEPLVLPPGSRRVRLVNPEMKVDSSFTVTVRPGETTSRVVILFDDP